MIMANPHPVSRKGKHNRFASARVERALAEGKRMPPEDLLTLASNCMAMAARYAPVRENPKTKAVESNPGFKAKDYMSCFTRTN
jgi:hypothetical protein